MDDKIDEENVVQNVNILLDNATKRTPQYVLSMDNNMPTPITDDPIDDDAYETEGDDEKIGNFTDDIDDNQSTETQNVLQYNSHKTKKCIDDNDSYCIEECDITFKESELNEQGERIYSISFIINILKQLFKRKIDRKVKQLGRDNKEYIEQMYDSMNSEINIINQKYLLLQQRINNMQPNIFYCIICVFVVLFYIIYQQHVTNNTLIQMNIETNNRINNIQHIFKQNQSAFESMFSEKLNDINYKITSANDAINMLQSQFIQQKELSHLFSENTSVMHKTVATFISQQMNVNASNAMMNSICCAFFSIIMIMFTVIGVFIFNYLVNGNDSVYDEFFNACHLQPNYAIENINNGKRFDSAEDQSCGRKLVCYQKSYSHNSQYTNNNISLNDDYKEDDSSDSDDDDMSPDEILNTYDYDSIQISEMDSDYYSSESSLSLLDTANINATTVHGSGSQTNSQTSQSTNNNNNNNGNSSRNSSQNSSSSRGYIPPSGDGNGDGNDPNKRHKHIEPTCGVEYKLILTTTNTKKTPTDNQNMNDENNSPQKSTLDPNATPFSLVWIAPDLDTITETPETPETPFDDNINYAIDVSNCTDDPTNSTEKKGEESPKLTPIRKTKRKKTKQFTSNNCSYEPDDTIRGQGNIKISNNMKKRTIPQKIKETVRNWHHYIDCMIAINDGKVFDTSNGVIKVFNLNFHDKITNEIAYCVAKQLIPENNRQYKWEINRIMTADEINSQYPRIFENDLPQCDHTFQPNEKHKTIIKDFIRNKNNRKKFKKMIRKAQWQNNEIIPVFSKMSKSGYKFKRELVLSVERCEFIEQIIKYIDSINMNNIHLIPIVMFKDSMYSIHYNWNIQIDDGNISIGISFQCESKNNIKITGLHCDGKCLLEQHQLILPESDEHKCNCFDAFQSNYNITHLKVYGNPDEIFWRDKYTKIKNVVRKFRDNGKYNFVYGVFCQEVKSLSL